MFLTFYVISLFFYNIAILCGYSAYNDQWLAFDRKIKIFVFVFVSVLVFNNNNGQCVYPQLTYTHTFRETTLAQAGKFEQFMCFFNLLFSDNW